MISRIKPVSVRDSAQIAIPQATTLKMNIVVLLSLIVATSVAAPAANPQVPASTYLMNYPGPFGFDNVQHEYRSAPAITSTLTDLTQAVANWQLLELRRKWIMIICLADPKCPSLPFPAKHPWAPARSYPLEFNDENMAAEYTRNDAQDLVYPYGTAPVADDVEGKSTAILTSAANFQMSQWIWRWNIILCLVNPSCPHVNIPATKEESRSDYYPSMQVNMEALTAANRDFPQRGVMVIPISFAPQ